MRGECVGTSGVSNGPEAVFPSRESDGRRESEREVP
jgi:hypothetical protein